MNPETSRTLNEAEEQLAIVAECISDLEELVKCNTKALTDDVKCATVKAFHVLSERVSATLQNLEYILRR